MPTLVNAEISSAPSQGSIESATKTVPAVEVDLSDDKDDFAMLRRLQGMPIHAPPGAKPLRTGAHTKTQLAADQKALKDSKAKAAEDKKLATAARKAGNLVKK